MQKEMLAVIRGEPVDLEAFYRSLSRRTRIHCEDTARLAAILLEWVVQSGLAGSDVPDPALLERCARYHDVGMALIPERLLIQKEDLTGAEFRVIQQHALYGGTLIDNWRREDPLSAEDACFRSLAAEVALSHHERWDGKGYPYGLRATAIPLAVRAVSIANTFDTIVRGSPYRIALPPEYALLEIIQNAGKQFDPNLVELARQNCEVFIGYECR